MVECEQHSTPAEQSAFSFAICPFHHEQTGHRIGSYLPSPTHTNPTHEPFDFPSPTQATAPVAEHANRVHGDALSEQHKDRLSERSDLIARVKSRHGPVAMMRRTQIQTMLLRCQVIQATIQSIQCRLWAKTGAAAIENHYEIMRQLAYKAYSLAEGVQEHGLQARSEYWAGRACAGTDDLRAAVEHFERAKLLDPYAIGEEHLFGLTAKEKKDLDILLQKVAQCIEVKETGDVASLPSPNSRVFGKRMEQEQLYTRYGSKIRRDSYWTKGPTRPEQRTELVMSVSPSLTSQSSESSRGTDGLEDWSENEDAFDSSDWQDDVKKYW